MVSADPRRGLKIKVMSHKDWSWKKAISSRRFHMNLHIFKESNYYVEFGWYHINIAISLQTALVTYENESDVAKITSGVYNEVGISISNFCVVITVRKKVAILFLFQLINLRLFAWTSNVLLYRDIEDLRRKF